MLGSYVEFIMLASVVVTPLIFLFMPVRQALVTAYCVMWMFLPVAVISLPAIPQLTKPAAISVGVFIAMVLFYADMIIKKYRFRWFDVPVVIFGVVMPFVSPLFNGDMGIEGAMFEMVNGLFLWVVPYFAGRIVLGDELGVETLAVGIFYAALIYTPFAWFEMLLSPQLHNKIYGWHQHEFLQTKRGWSYRPMVFMTHGLMTSMWMVAGAICGLWLLYHKRLKWKWMGSPKMAVGFVLFTAAVSNSAGATLLLGVALCILFATKKISPSWVLVPLLLVTPVYIVSRSMNIVQSQDLVQIVEPISIHRAASLQFRMDAEDAYVAKAMERPMMGWGGYGRHRPVDEETGKKYTADGLWIIVFGKTGTIGLVCMVLTFLAVPAIIIIRQGPRVWRDPRFAAAGALTVLMCIYAIDNLLNAMVNPFYMLVLGALATYATQPLAKKFKARRPRKGSSDEPEPKQAYKRPVGIVT